MGLKLTNSNNLSRKVVKSNYIQRIIHSTSFEEALNLKELMEQDGISPNRKVYYELLQKTTSKDIVLEVKRELDEREICLNEGIYIALFKKDLNFHDKLILIEEMENKGIFPTIKTYYTLIKYERDFKKALFVFNRMKQREIDPDSKLYNILVKKALGENEFNMLYKEKKQYEMLERVLNSQRLSEDINSFISELITTGQIQEIEYINKLLNRIGNCSNIVKLVTACLDQQVDINHLTYWYFLQKTAEEGCVDKYEPLLKDVKNCLDEVEIKKLYTIFDKKIGNFGGKGKFIIQRNNQVNMIYKEAMNCTKENHFYHLLGKSIGLEMNKNEIEEIDISSHEIEFQDDQELFKYEQAKLTGILEGIQLQQQLKEEWLNRRTPMLVLAYIEDEVTLNHIESFSISHGFYPYEMDEINQLKLSGCYFTNSMVHLCQVIKLIDFELYDVSINFFCDKDSNQFINKQIEFGDLFTFLDKKRGKTFLQLKYITLKEKDQNNAKASFHSLYNYLTFTPKSNATKRKSRRKGEKVNEIVGREK